MSNNTIKQQERGRTETIRASYVVLYMATWIDVFSRKVVGWAMNKRMTEQ
jgi:hypothetical protein